MFASALLFGAFAALASAQQEASSVLFFTHVPNPVTDGQPQALTYSTNDTASPVTITLRHGDPRNLQTVEVLTSDASAGQYSWTPCAALPNGNDYVLEIRQASQVNYYGPFVVQGASASGTCSGIVSTASATSSSKTTSTGSARSTASLPSGVTFSGTSSLTSSMSRNATMTRTSASLGTGTAMHRNMTLSSATLSKTVTSSITITSTSTTTTTSNPGANFQSTSASPSPSGGAAADMRGSSVALVLGAVAAVLLG